MKFEYAELRSRTGRERRVYIFDNVEFYDGLIDTLNSIGADGWEMCGEVDHITVMKRLISE